MRTTCPCWVGRGFSTTGIAFVPGGRQEFAAAVKRDEGAEDRLPAGSDEAAQPPQLVAYGSGSDSEEDSGGAPAAKAEPEEEKPKLQAAGAWQVAPEAGEDQGAARRTITKLVEFAASRSGVAFIKTGRATGASRCCAACVQPTAAADAPVPLLSQ